MSAVTTPANTTDITAPDPPAPTVKNQHALSLEQLVETAKDYTLSEEMSQEKGREIELKCTETIDSLPSTSQSEPLILEDKPSDCTSPLHPSETNENDDDSIEEDMHNDSSLVVEKSGAQEAKFVNGEQKKKFQEWIGQHSDNLYPTKDEKLGLAKQLNASYLQVTRLLANHRRRLQLQRKRKPANKTNEDKDAQNSSGDKENQADAGVNRTELNKLVLEHLQSVVDDISSIGSKHNVDEETRMSHVSQLHCDESFDDLDELIESNHPFPIKANLKLMEKNQRIDFVIDEVIQYVNQLPMGGNIPQEMVVHESAADIASQFDTLQMGHQTQQLPTVNRIDSPVVAEFNRRVMALMRIQQEMKEQKGHSVVKELDSNYAATPPPSAPLSHGDLTQLAHQSTPTNTSLNQNIPSVTATPTAINGVHLSTSTKDLDKCNTVLSQQSSSSLVDNNVSFGQQQQVMHTLSQLNLNTLLPSQPTISTNQQSQNNLFPLIQKFLAGGLLPPKTEDKLLDQGRLAQRQTIPSTLQTQQPTGTSLALNQLIGNSSANDPVQQLSTVVSTNPAANQLGFPLQSNQHSSQNDPNMLYPSSFQSTFMNAFANCMNNGTQPPFMGTTPVNNTIPQQPNVMDILRQVILQQQQQSSILTFLQQNREQMAKLVVSTGASLNQPINMTPDFLGVSSAALNEKTAAYVGQTNNGLSHLMSPPLSSNASSSPRLFSNEPVFSDISTCSNSPVPLDTSFNSSTVSHPSRDQSIPAVHAFATPPETVKPIKGKKKTKKQLKLEQMQQNGENLTPASRKRRSDGKRETSNEKKARLAAEAALATKQSRAAIVPRKINELTESESIAISVLAGLANGRFS